jgi:hypothetical protein
LDGYEYGTISWQVSNDRIVWNDLVDSKDSIAYKIPGLPRGKYYRAKVENEGLSYFSKVYEVFEKKCTSLISFKLSADVDVSSIRIRFAPLKYNKQFAYGVTSDDSRIDAWSRLFQYFKGGWIDDITNYHSNMVRSTGAYVPRALTYTDGCGVKRIFPVNSANWYNLRQQYWSYPMDKPNPTKDWPYMVWDEQIQINDFDGGCTFHDVQDPNAAIGNIGGDIEMIKRGLVDADSLVRLKLGRGLMVLSEPNGNSNYSEAAKELPFINVITRQYDKNQGFNYVNMGDANLSFDNMKIARYFNDGGSLLAHKTSFIDNIVTPSKSINGVYMYGEFGLHGLYGDGTFISNNISNSKKLQFFDWLCDTYGAGTETATDELWFATNDEVLQYKYLNTVTEYSYEIEGDHLKIWIEVPEVENFYWYEYTLLLDGINIEDVTEVSSDDHVIGLSYGESDGEMMLNVNFDKTLLDRAEKYTSLFETCMEKYGPTEQVKEYKRDAEYFIQRLKPELQSSFTERLSSDLLPHLSKIEINAGLDTTQFLNNDIHFNYTGIPLEYRIGENIEEAEWQAFSDEIQYTISAGAGLKVVYAQLKNSFGESIIVSDSIYFDDSMAYPNSMFEGKYVGVISIKIPSDTDLSNIKFSFAPLKYNKRFAYSITSDDSRIDTWNRLFQYFKGGWIDDVANSHSNMDRSTGAYASRALTYTDGCGVKRIFPVNSANWYNLRRQYWSYPMDKLNPTKDWPYMVWDEQIQINDFDGGCTLHDVQDPNAAIDVVGGDVEMIKRGISDANAYVKQRLGRGLMALSEPNGDSNYSEAALASASIRMITRQQSKDLGFLYVDLADKNLKFNKIKVGRFINDSGSLQTYITSFNNDIVKPSQNGVHMYGEFGLHGLYGNGTITSSNISSSNKIQFFNWLCDTYGAGTEAATDELWVATNDEVLQYKHLSQITKYSYTIEDGYLKIRLVVPEIEDFYWHEYTLLIDGIVPNTVTDIITDESIIGASFGGSDGKMMVNINFDETLLDRAEKYTSLFEESLSVNGSIDLTKEYQQDAEYFVQRLKPQLQTSFINRLSSSNLCTTLTKIEISNGQDTTSVINNEIKLHYSGIPVEYRIGENLDDSPWLPFTEQIQYRLSEGAGNKTIYAQLRNSFCESEIVNGTIYYDDSVLNPISIKINSGIDETESVDLKIVMNYEGLVTSYRISEDPSFESASWILHTSDTIDYTIEDSSIGLKTIYVQLRNDNQISSKILSGNIYLRPYTHTTAVLSLAGDRIWNKIEYHTIADGNLTVNLVQADIHTSYTSKQLASKTNEMLPWFFELNNTYYPKTNESIVEGNNITSNTYYSPTLNGNTGPYPDSFIARGWVLKTKGHEGKGRLVFTLPKGTYQFKFIMSVSASATVNSYQLPECFYRVDVAGVKGEPVNVGNTGFTGLNNTQFNAEIDNVVVDEEGAGNVVVYIYNTGSSFTARPAINLLEISKLK